MEPDILVFYWKMLSEAIISDGALMQVLVMLEDSGEDMKGNKYNKL